ncbi:ABC transporter ATP-binding protein [Methanohalophilus sp. RSK]|uniref:ABC transporter ATP-binding protein n=1 Tax=Methanohalophilus sp. RSK TaxID=2485783 RepID=UPI000F43D421|nr:ABC transporter ATP-binding protein [Methanohalophilus sp. RSK]RNI12064.1 ABC transporter ATP-binding protein [Methanohalophilus sp. RSK]
MMNSIVEVNNAVRTYRMGSSKVHALKGVSFEVREGDFLAIMGSSGSGKSTMLNLIGCLDKPTKGTIHINGVNIAKLNDDGLTDIRRDNIGFIFQQFNLIPTLTALENVEIPMIFKRLGPQKRRKKALKMLELAQLGREYATHKPGELSGGQQQRVAIARALANDPPIILADEPTGNLDSKTGKGVMELLSDLNRKGKTLIVVTHDPKIIEYSNTTIYLQDGEVVDEID